MDVDAEEDEDEEEEGEARCGLLCVVAVFPTSLTATATEGKEAVEESVQEAVVAVLLLSFELINCGDDNDEEFWFSDFTLVDASFPET